RIGMRLAARRREACAQGSVMSETMGVAVPGQGRELIAQSTQLGTRIGMHFQGTRDTGVANGCAALEAGVTAFESSLGGLGGCPFAPRATGNVATEDLVYLFHGEGVQTGIDLGALIGAAEWLEGILARRLRGGVSCAVPVDP